MKFSADPSASATASNMWARSFFPRADCNFLAPPKEYYRHSPLICQKLAKKHINIYQKFCVQHFEIARESGFYTSRTRTSKQYSAATLSGYVKSGHSRWLSSSVHVRLTDARSSDCSITYAYTIYSHIFTLLNFGGKSQNRVQWGKST